MVLRVFVLLLKSESNQKKIAIMQPTFLPWIGYFSLIDYVDEFIILDHVQFNRRSWQQRNKILLNNNEFLITIPVYTKGLANQSISNVKISHNSKENLNKIFKTITFAYSKTIFFNDYQEELYNILTSEKDSLINLNLNLIKWGCQKLGITTPILKSSDLKIEGKKEELLVNLCIFRQATNYISPPGSKNYLTDNYIFKENKIILEYFNYQHPIYTQQSKEFIPYLSFLDILFNNGLDSLSIIKSGNKN